MECREPTVAMARADAAMGSGDGEKQNLAMTGRTVVLLVQVARAESLLCMGQFNQQSIHWSGGEMPESQGRLVVVAPADEDALVWVDLRRLGPTVETVDLEPQRPKALFAKDASPGRA
jgi:hypothetical protein